MTNSSHSPTIQHLLDVAKKGKGQMTVEQLLAELQDDSGRRSDLCKELDEEWDRHQYPDKHMKYTKVANYNQCRARFEVSPNANMILTLFECVANQTGLVQLAMSDIKRLCFSGTKIALKTVRTAIKELLNAGFITIKVPQTFSEAAIYMINPDVSKAGKPATEHDRKTFRQLLGEESTAPLLYKLLQTKNDNIGIVVLKYQDPITNETIKYNSLRSVLKKEQKKSTTVATAVPKAVHEQANSNILNTDTIPQSDDFVNECALSDEDFSVFDVPQSERGVTYE